VWLGIATAMDATTFSILVLVGLSKGVDSVSDSTMGLLQKRERMDWIAQIIGAKAVATALVFGVILCVGRSLWTALLGVVALRTLLLFVLDFRRVRRTFRDASALRPTFHLATGFRIARQSAPLGLVLLLLSLSSGIPRFFLRACQGDAALGFFTAMTYVQALGIIVVTALTEATVARMARDFQDAPRRFTALLAKLLGFAGVLGAVGILLAMFFGRPFLELVYDKSYAAHSDVFVWIMVGLAGGEMQAFIGAALIAMRCFRVRAAIALATTLACLASAWFLVPRYGMTGGAWSIIVSTWTGFALGMCCLGVVLLRARRAMGVERRHLCPTGGE
jgi:O-antigen/teichoic acid export membrane protein